jgi:hypothetical protein
MNWMRIEGEELAHLRPCIDIAIEAKSELLAASRMPRSRCGSTSCC